MKKIFYLTSILILVVFTASAQWNTNGTNIYNTNSGNVGVGISSPGYLLHVAKNMTSPSIRIQNLGGGGGAAFEMVDNLSGADWKFKATATGGFKIRDNAAGFDVIQVEAGSAANVIYINAAGNLGIGTNNPTEKLSINGNVKCKQVEVTLSGWSDFVFEDDYPLMPLADVEKYITEHNHLPGVPSADDVIGNSTNLGEMDAILL